MANASLPAAVLALHDVHPLLSVEQAAVVPSPLQLPGRHPHAFTPDLTPPLASRLGASPAQPLPCGASVAASPTCSSPGSDSPFGSPRNHYRSATVLEACHLSPDEARWECKAAEGKGLQLAASPKEGGGTWSKSTPTPGVLCPSNDILAVCDSSVHIIEPTVPLASAPGASIFRRRSLHGDPHDDD